MSNEYVSCSFNISDDLENELFKIAAVFNYAHKYKKIPVFNSEHGRSMYNSVLNTMDKSEYDTLNFTILKENNSYTEFENVEGNVLLKGNFYSLQYYTAAVKNKMISIIYSNEDYMFDAYTYYENIKRFFTDLELQKNNNNVEINDDDMISLYVRVDNYKLLEYKNELETISKLLLKARDSNKKYVAIFSNDIAWCKEFIKDDYVYFVKTKNNDYNPEEFQFIILSFFKNNIIYNDKYSWYASFISSFKDKLIIDYNKKYRKINILNVLEDYDNM